VKDRDIDAIVAIARGGMTLGHFLANGLGIREIYSINSVHYEGDRKLDFIKISNIPDLNGKKRVLIVDDIVDSGDSMSEVLRLLKERYPDVDFITLSLFYKKSASIKPDLTLHEAKEWIEFFWEEVMP
jgi:xanthine phosphoribosyltransferase